MVTRWPSSVQRGAVMRRSLTATLLCLLLAPAGCVPLQQFIDPDSTTAGSSLVSGNRFGGAAPEQPMATVNFSPAETELSVRVVTIGNRLVHANPELGLRTMFATYGQ